MRKFLTTLLCTFGMLIGLNTAAWAQCAGTYPLDIPDNDVAGTDILCTVPDVTNITDVTLDVDITHTWVGDLKISITDPSGGTTALVVNGPNDGDGGSGCGTNNMRITISDSGADGTVDDCLDEAISDLDAYIVGGSYTPTPDPMSTFAGMSGLAEDGKQGLGAFKGASARGVWTVNVSDDQGGDTGTVDTAPVLTVTGTPLPVELVSFDGLLDGDTVELQWVTATEENNAGFEIEHKAGNGEFQAIGYVEGAGTTQEEQHYRFRVADVGFGNQVFRLKQIDFDGTFEYSDEVEVTRELADGYLLTEAYPNPFNPQTNFSLLIASDQQVDVGVYNMLGQRVHTVFSGVLTGQEWHQMTFQSTSLPSGTYLIRSTGESFVNTQKVILVK